MGDGELGWQSKCSFVYVLERPVRVLGQNPLKQCLLTADAAAGTP